ncbi:hypothetical protein FHH43_08515 [Clostridium perfringens]|nr:hypothetical protein [Clostridium perfringens]
MSEMIYNRKPNHCCNAKCDPCRDKKDPCRDKDRNPCREENRVEFRFDETTPDPRTLIPTPLDSLGVELLSVTFDEVERRDRVWLSGVIQIDNESNAVPFLRIRIVKDSPNMSPTTIYTLTVQIDAEGRDDVQAIPFSHVDVNNVDLFDVRYRVFASTDVANALFSEGPNTLTALRFERK